ncbi:hypothetical protein RN001_005678 [Aquatica leii]|uniref:EB domain-containing protein n=1 Tax=Aquatica leii TaxID=1421715 RepID=A0AAN7SJ01_9COLE|nr:hypothetical protein RN001_005678 [Aquatica leii]
MCKVESVFSQAKILAFQNCRTDADCFKNSYCYADREERKKCRCKENFILTPINKTVYECLPVAGFGDACDIDVQCQVQLGSLATCDETDNVCKCINDAHLGNDKMCHQSVALGGLCKTNNNCLLSDGSYGVCYVGKCTCNTYQHPSESGNTCVESAILNGECESKENCLQAFSNCYGGICRCIPGYVESEHNIKCLLGKWLNYSFIGNQ